MLTGRAGLQLEYLGESYYSEQALTAEDLGLPPGTPIVSADTTRFTDQSWLPGPRLALSWRRDAPAGPRLEIDSRTAFDAQNFSQDAEARAVFADPAEPRRVWRLTAGGTVREDARSLVGHGDWNARAEAARETPLSPDVLAALRASWEHSRGRGDTTSYLYDYDRARIRGEISRGGAWLPAWRSWIEAAAKQVPGGGEGAYAEARAGAEWRPGGSARTRLELDLHGRNYRVDEGIGRDYAEASLDAGARLAGDEARSVGLEGGINVTDYRGSDELYFDGATLDLFVPARVGPGPWTVTAGPAGEFFRDLEGAGRDYGQGTVRLEADRVFSGAGFGDFHLETGYRGYRTSSAQAVEISSLSASILRTDYWLVDLLAVLNLPVGRGLAVDVLASASWEFHPEQSERIGVGFVNLGVSRDF